MLNDTVQMLFEVRSIRAFLQSMPIPDFQSIMRPLMQAHADGEEHVNRDLVAQLADEFGMTEEERREMLPGGERRTVGRPEIQKFAGALQGQRARKGIFITTSAFSSEATDYVSRIEVKIILIDGAFLTKLMFDHSIGVATTSRYKVKRVDTDYFSEN